MARRARPFGENTNSGKKMMTSYTRSFTGSPTLKVSGKKASANGTRQVKNRANSNTYGGPTSKSSPSRKGL